MSNGKSGAKKIFTTIIAIVIVAIASVFGIDLSDILDTGKTEGVQTSINNSIENVEGTLILTMIDVGQADAFLFEHDGMTALVDCGTRHDGDDIIKFLNEKGIEKLDFVFGTHPHDDHMGGMLEVITNIQVGKIIIPDVEENKATSNWYESLILELASGEYDVEYAKEDSIYYVGDAKFHILTQLEEYNGDLNNYSAIMKVSFGEMDVIMTGDAETVVEKVAIDSGKNLSAEILKVGHHGSDTSSSKEFLDAIAPDYALISVGLGNKHEHPIKSTMDKLLERNIDVFRTDESGTVVVTITESDISFNTDPDDYLDGIEAEKRYAK